ncbi:hypothetical protein, partial [Rhizobium sp. PL01]|uniref:hypothetical protein n=1 Tax=Rhizobium sp. PL01 TaxID=3085631 RepID=UPI002981B472
GVSALLQPHFARASAAVHSPWDLESRAVIPARSSYHATSCSRFLSRTQTQIPLILAAKISEPRLNIAENALVILIICRPHALVGASVCQFGCQAKTDVDQARQNFCRHVPDLKRPKTFSAIPSMPPNVSRERPTALRSYLMVCARYFPNSGNF